MTPSPTMRSAAIRRATTVTVAPARRKPEPSPDLFEHAGVIAPHHSPPLDPRKLVRWATGIFRASIDARHCVLRERWAAAQNLVLPDEIDGEVLRFHPGLRFGDDRKPGLIFLLRDVFNDEPCGIVRHFLNEDGSVLAKRSLGRTSFNAAVKLDADENVTEGLCIASSIETGIAAMNAGYRPLWCVIGANALAALPVIGGVEALTIIAGDDEAKAIEECSMRWTAAFREVLVVNDVEK